MEQLTSTDISKYLAFLSSTVDGTVAGHDAVHLGGRTLQASLYVGFGLLRIAEAIESHTKAQPKPPEFCFGAWDRVSA